MGGVMSSLFPLFDRLVSGKREYRILMLGLDAAGTFLLVVRCCRPIVMALVLVVQVALLARNKRLG
jgi:hypothetical protein